LVVTTDRIYWDPGNHGLILLSSAIQMMKPPHCLLTLSMMRNIPIPSWARL